ncbi:MAG: VOC family protein [Nocardioides sp.]|uniref:VOC family protein n=1 Tax=Nocardioides sp. TaxID=35761 RepID=UPI0039E4C3CE
MEFTDPQVILFVADCERAAAFYAEFGFVERFRAPRQDPVKIEMDLGGFALGLALPGPAAESHGITPVVEGHRAAMTLWTDDVEAAYAHALSVGAADHRGPHPFLDGRLRVAFVEDPDGHPVQLVQRVVPSAADAGARGTR